MAKSLESILKQPQAPIPHLTTVELASRWRCTRETISRKYRQWGLRPIRIAGALLFPLDQIEDCERRLMVAGPGDTAAS